MEKCKKCGHILNENDKFCPECGEKRIKRTVIYSPKAEDIVVVEETSSIDKSNDNISNTNKSEKVWIKCVRVIYVIVLSIISLLFLAVSITSFKGNDIKFSIYFMTIALIIAFNIYFFIERKWKKYGLTYLLIVLATAVSILTYDTKPVLKPNNSNAPVQLTESEYKEKCGTYDYEEIARYPDRYIGEYTHVYGQAIQVIENNNTYQIRVATRKNEYMDTIADTLYELDSNVDKSLYESWSEDIIYVTYTNKAEARILENDMIDIYGELNGLKTYTSTLGSSITIPQVKAKYIDIKLD